MSLTSIFITRYINMGNHITVRYKFTATRWKIRYNIMLLWFVKSYERNLKKLQFTTQRFDTNDTIAWDNSAHKQRQRSFESWRRWLLPDAYLHLINRLCHSTVLIDKRLKTLLHFIVNFYVVATTTWSFCRSVLAYVSDNYSPSRWTVHALRICYR